MPSRANSHNSTIHHRGEPRTGSCSSSTVSAISINTAKYFLFESRAYSAFSPKKSSSSCLLVNHLSQFSGIRQEIAAKYPFVASFCMFCLAPRILTLQLSGQVGAMELSSECSQLILPFLHWETLNLVRAWENITLLCHICFETRHLCQLNWLHG